jgi:hypothetical protein
VQRYRRRGVRVVFEDRTTTDDIFTDDGHGAEVGEDDWGGENTGGVVTEFGVRQVTGTSVADALQYSCGAK